MNGLRAPAIGVVLALLAPGCRKTVADTQVTWMTDVEAAQAKASKEKKLVLVFAHASWDTSSVQLEKQTFEDPEVKMLLASDFVAISVDDTDDENEGVRRMNTRFTIVGTPTIAVYQPDLKTEVFRLYQFAPAKGLAPRLREAARHSRTR